VILEESLDDVASTAPETMWSCPKITRAFARPVPSSVYITRCPQLAKAAVQRLAFKFTLTMAAYDLIKLPRLIAAAA
jgi:hypothetical protein